ncbi:helix-turn-helix domain-containing protein [Nannocystaceae bacterium ST9]
MSKRVHWLRDPAQIAALAAPLRAALVDRLEAQGPCSVRELAEQLGVQPDALHYHVRMLVGIGLLEQVGSRPTRRHDEALYDLAHRRCHIAHAPSEPGNAEALTKLAKTILSQANQDFAEGLASARAKGSRPGRNLWTTRIEAELSASELRELEGHLEAIVELLRKPEPARGRRGRKLVALSWVLAPIEVAAGRRRSKRSRPIAAAPTSITTRKRRAS